MKIKNGFTLHQIGDEHIIMHNGTGNVDFSNIIRHVAVPFIDIDQ